MYKNYQKEKQSNCLICFKSLNDDTSLFSLFSLNNLICNNCKRNFKPINKIEYVNNIETLFLYEYDDFFKSLIYQFKGCYDIALKDVFLYMHKNKLKKKYKGFTIIFPPSNKDENDKRGFIHIKEMVRCLNLPILDIFYKSSSYKQSSFKFKDRYKIEKVITLKEGHVIENKKYLIVDDIYTSGSTLKTIIKLLVNHGIEKKKIKALILCKTKNNVEL